MSELDPVLLIAVGTAIVSIASIAVCMRPSKSNKTTRAETQSEVVKPKAAKKKSKSSKNKASKTVDGAEEVVKSLSNDSKVGLTFSTPELSKAQPDNFSDTTLLDDATKKSKKDKKAQDLKMKKLEREKAAKVEIVEEDDEDDDEDSPVKPSLPAPKPLPVPRTLAMEPLPQLLSTAPASFDGWAVVGKVKAKKNDVAEVEEAASPVVVAPSKAAKVAKKEKEVAAIAESELPIDVPPPSVTVIVEEPAVPAAPVVETVTTLLTVEARKLGLLIGPKGITKIGMQTATGTEILMPKVEKDFVGPVEIAVTGTAEGVARAVVALNELCNKGYCNLLADADFHEGYVAVHPRYLPDIIGKGGICIKAIQNHTGVKISTPSGYTRTTPAGETIVPAKVKIGLAGHRDKVTVARNLILDLTKYYHTPVTHPDTVHVEMDVPSQYYNYIIGSKGSEIKHIQANFKVNVFIPNAESVNPNLLVVGEQAGVSGAEKHILKLVEKVELQVAERAKAEAEGVALGESAKAKYAAAKEAAAAAGGNSSHRVASTSVGGGGASAAPSNGRGPRPEREEPEEEWVAEYAPRRNLMNMGAMLPASAKFAAAPAPAPVVVVAAAPTAAAPVDVAAPVEEEPAVLAAASSGSGASSAWGGMAALPAETW